MPRKIDILVEGMCALFLDESKPLGMFAVIPMDGHEASLSIREKGYISGNPFVLAYPSLPRQIVLRTNTPGSIHKHLTGVNSPQSFDAIIDVEEDGPAMVNFEKAEHLFYFEKGLIYSRLLSSEPVEIVSSTSRVQRPAEIIGVSIDLNDGEVAEIILGTKAMGQQETIPLNSATGYEIVLRNACLPNTRVRDDFNEMYKTGFVASLTPVTVNSVRSRHENLGSKVCNGGRYSKTTSFPLPS